MKILFGVKKINLLLEKYENQEIQVKTMVRILDYSQTLPTEQLESVIF
jgi:hypothetical protein